MVQGVTGAVGAILNQIQDGLKRLIDDDVSTGIDLRTLPLTASELAQLTDFLGAGEVTAVVSALGRSEVRETRYPGLWLVTHWDTSERVQGRVLEITDIPEILKTQRADALAGHRALSARLAQT